MKRPPRKVSPIGPLSDQIGEFIAYWGFKRVHGRIWTHLVVSDRPLDASALMKKLGISKALVSMSLADLLHYSVVEEAGKSPRGTLLYRANPQFWDVILNVLKIREREMLLRIHAAQSLVERISSAKAKKHELDMENVAMLGELIGAASEALETFLLKMRFDLSFAKSLKVNPARAAAN